MEQKSIKNHWESWASKYQKDLRATTKTQTIKKLEINALFNAISKTGIKTGNILEIGCGNGYNCISLAQSFPQLNFTGVDFVEQMVNNANILAKDLPDEISSRLKYFQGNALDLINNSKLLNYYDVIFTNRCLINLPNDELQIKAIDQILKKLINGGNFIMLENMKDLRNIQNKLRSRVKLNERSVPEYNHFMDENAVLAYLLDNNCELLFTSDFGSLHDLILYILLPMINNGEILYDHPIMDAVTEFLLQNNDYKIEINGVGQNRLFSFKKL